MYTTGNERSIKGWKQGWSFWNAWTSAKKWSDNSSGDLAYRLLSIWSKFLKNIPLLKENVVIHGKHSLEIEYEQMIIRANNFEPRNNSEYFIIDRQYVIGKQRFDLAGIFWDRKARRKGQEVDLCFIEVKFALNQDISEVHNQLKGYYEAIRPRAKNIAEEGETIFRQKLELGLYNQSAERIEAMKTLSF